MKRSHINEVLARSEAFVAAHRFALPPFAYWAPERWREPEAAPLRAAGLGWDVTDYGAGRFDTYGLTLFTIRNGRLADLAAGRGRLYAEKILIAGDGQLAPMHRHDLKVEDIINRGGGTLVLELYGAAEDGALDKHRAAEVWVDGIARTIPPGETLRLKAGESVTLYPNVWHAFWGEDGDVLAGEVSTVNDDVTDNIFDPPVPRFAEVEEDAAPRRLLVSDYGRLS
jgi:D-lyxose ketol-isomerase